MAPKNAEVIKNPPIGSSSDEEESGSSGEESESSAEDSKKDESKLESDSEGESGSDSDSEPVEKKKPVVTSGSAVTSLPESSSAKRPLKQAETEGSKKVKISETEHVKKKPKSDDEVKKISGEDAKKMFQRLFSETDEIALLQGILDFTSTKGDPYEESDAFCVYVKKLIDFNANKNQIVTKLQRLKKKFVNTVKKFLKKGKSEDEIVFSKDLEQKAFELSRKIWGENGVLASKSRKKLGGSTKELVKIGVNPKETVKLRPHSSPKKQEEENEKQKVKVVSTGVSIAREIASVFHVENASVCGLDETTISAVWENVADGGDKREMEQKWKKLKKKQVELCLERTELVNETAKMIFKAYES